MGIEMALALVGIVLVLGVIVKFTKFIGKVIAFAVVIGFIVYQVTKFIH